MSNKYASAKVIIITALLLGGCVTSPALIKSPDATLELTQVPKPDTVPTATVFTSPSPVPEIILTQTTTPSIENVEVKTPTEVQEVAIAPYPTNADHFVIDSGKTMQETERAIRAFANDEVIKEQELITNALIRDRKYPKDVTFDFLLSEGTNWAMVARDNTTEQFLLSTYVNAKDNTRTPASDLHPNFEKRLIRLERFTLTPLENPPQFPYAKQQLVSDIGSGWNLIGLIDVKSEKIIGYFDMTTSQWKVPDGRLMDETIQASDMEPVKDTLVLPCEMKLSDPENYPFVENFFDLVRTGEAATAFRNQQVFQKRMEAMKVKNPFNPDTVIKGAIPSFGGNGMNKYFFPQESDEAQSGFNKPESANMWPICGVNMEVNGYKIHVIVTAYPSNKASDKFELFFGAIPFKEETGNPELYSKFIGRVLKSFDVHGGQITPMVPIVDLRFQFRWDPDDTNIGWIPEMCDALSITPGYNAAAEQFVTTGKAPKGIETQILPVHLFNWQ
jgi:hypothetical protein